MDFDHCENMLFKEPFRAFISYKIKRLNKTILNSVY